MVIHFKGGNFRSLEKWPHTKTREIEVACQKKKSGNIDLQWRKLRHFFLGDLQLLVRLNGFSTDE